MTEGGFYPNIFSILSRKYLEYFKLWFCSLRFVYSFHGQARAWFCVRQHRILHTCQDLGVPPHLFLPFQSANKGTLGNLSHKQERSP